VTGLRTEGAAVDAGWSHGTCDVDLEKGMGYGVCFTYNDLGPVSPSLKHQTVYGSCKTQPLGRDGS
jgi:hypothetical protein